MEHLQMSNRVMWEIHLHSTANSWKTTLCDQDYLGSDGGGGDVRGGAVLCGGHAAVLLLLLLLLTLHPLVLRLAVRAAGGQRGQRRRRRGQVLQLIGHLLHFDHGFSEQVDGVRESRKDELEAFLHTRKEKDSCISVLGYKVSPDTLENASFFHCFGLSSRLRFVQWKLSFLKKLTKVNKSINTVYTFCFLKRVFSHVMHIVYPWLYCLLFTFTVL